MPFVQSIGFSATGAASVSATLNGVAAGNFLATVGSFWDNTIGGQAQNNTPTDTQSNAWNTTTAPTQQDGGNAFICYAEDVNAGNTQVTLTTGGNTYCSGEFLEFSGVLTSGSLDQQTSNSNAGSTTPTSGTTGTLAQADELVLACVQGNQVQNPYGFDVPATTGYSNVFVEQDGNNAAGSGDYKEVAATTAVSAAWGTLAGSYSWSAKIATFRLSAPPPVITDEPDEQTAADGATASFSITATGATSYQWQRLPPGGGSWANVSGGSGGTTASYTTPTLSRASDAGALYRCQATNSSGTTDSAAALLRVTAIPSSYAAAVGLVIGSEASFVGESYVGSSDAGGGYSLTAAQGSYAFTGQSTGLRAARRVVAAQGSYALTGQAAGVRRGFPLVAAQGAYTLTGQLVALRLARRITAAQGAYALNGQAAAVRAARLVAAAQGSYALNGQAATLSYTPGAKILGAAQGAYALTGQTVGLKAGRLVAAGQGSYALNGQAVALRVGRKVGAAQGSYGITGQASALRIGRVLIAAQGAYSINGQVVALRVARVLTAGQGAYALNGQAAGLIYSQGAKILGAAAGSYVLTGQAATLRAGRRMPAAQGAYALNGQASALRVGRKVGAAPGSYALTGQAAALRYGRGAFAAPGAYTLQGQVIGLRIARRVVLESGSYAMAGLPVGLRYLPAAALAGRRSEQATSQLERPASAGLKRSSSPGLKRK